MIVETGHKPVQIWRIFKIVRTGCYLKKGVG